MTTTRSKTARRVKSSTHIFNLRLYLEGLKRLRISGIAIAILALTVSAIIPIASWLEMAERATNTAWQVHIDIATCIPTALLVFAAPLFAADLFSFLFKRKESDFFHAIPYTRACVYISFSAAIVTLIAAIMVACGLVTGILWSLCPFATVKLGEFCAFILISILAAVLLAGFMLLAMTVTGTSGSAALLFVLFACLARAVAGIFLGMLDSISLLKTEEMLLTSPLSPFWFLPISVLTSLLDAELTQLMYAPANILYSILVTIAIYSLAGVLYARRHSEMAGNPAPGRKTQALFRILFALPFVLLLPLCLIHDTDAYVIVIIIAATLLVYFLYELITTRCARNMLKALPGLAAVAAATLLFAGIFLATRTFLLTESIPASDMASVTLDDLNRYTVISLEDTALEDPEVLAVIADCLADTQAAERRREFYSFDDSTRVTATIRLKNGRTLIRRIALDNDRYRAYLAALARREELRAVALELPPTDEINTVDLRIRDALGDRKTYICQDDMKTYAPFLEIFAEEFAALSDEQKLAHIVLDPDSIPEDGANDPSIRYYVRLRGNTRGTGTYFLSTYILDDALPRTLAAYLTLLGQHHNSYDYTIRSDVTAKEDILADLSDFFSNEDRRPVQFFDPADTYVLTLEAFGADGIPLFTETAERRAPHIVTIADRLAATLAVTSRTKPGELTVTPETYLVHVNLFGISNEGGSEVNLWLVCKLTPEDIEALRKSMW